MSTAEKRGNTGGMRRQGRGKSGLPVQAGGVWRCGASQRRGEGTPPYGCITRGAVQTGRRGNRRSAAGGGRSEPVSRKCPDWRPRQWTGIGWHDGGQSPPPTDAWQGNAVRCKRSTDCHVASLLAMTGLDGAVRDGRRGEGSESSAAGGGRSEMSEWPRSKFQASAVRQRRNFGHRNRITPPYGCGTWGTELVKRL